MLNKTRKVVEEKNGMRAFLTWGLAALVVTMAWGRSTGASAESSEAFTPASPFDVQPRRVECQQPPGTWPANLARAFELMLVGPEKAVACAKWLDRTMPGWREAPGTENLVVPFVKYLLGDGTSRGLQRHQIFIDLLGPLEDIAPGWRFDPRVKALMPEIILGSTVEDPFVAHFWTTTLQEMDPDWRETDTAQAMLSAVYERALNEATKPAGPRNERPAALLKTLSWPRYAWLKVYAGAFASWPKRIVSTVVVLLLLVVTFRALRRRKTP